jgi:hypothetical protein
MTESTIQCPECGASIEISEVLSQQIEKDLRASLESNNKKQLQNAVETERKRVLDEMSVEITDRDNRIQESEQKLQLSQEKELDIRKQARKLETREKALDKELDKRLKEEAIKLEAKLSLQAQENATLEMEDIKNQLQETVGKIDIARKTELALRKEIREVEEKKQDMELENQRKLDQERKAIEEHVREKYAEKSNFKLQEKEKQIADLRKALGDAKRKSEQGSMETQGEVLELQLEDQLQTRFLHDVISPVLKGAKGADLIQEVRDSSLVSCGSIIWEAKNTKKWQPAWLQKLRDDQRMSSANIAILVSVTLPEGVQYFDVIDGVWVAGVQSYMPLAIALREQLIQVSFARSASKGKNEKMEFMYEYLSGSEFQQKIEGIVEAFTSMQDQINRERRAMEKLWKEREKQIQRITCNTVGMYGDIRGIIGSSVSPIKALELDDDLFVEEGSVDG